MVNSISINDELNEFKSQAKKFGKVITKIEKIGNGNMSAFRVFYHEKDHDDLKEQFFWRHDMNKLLKIFEEEYHKTVGL